MNTRLKELRISRNLTQTQLGYFTHTTQSLISKLESGECRLTEDIIINFSNFFGVSSDYFLYLTDEKLPINLKLSLKKDAENFHTLCYYYNKLNFEQKNALLHMIRTIPSSCEWYF